MNYIGSKKSLLKFLEDSINEVVDKDCHVFCDLFAGTGSVGTHFKKKGYRVIANDIQYYSYVLNKQYICNHRELTFEQLRKEIPELKDIEIDKRRVFVCDYLSKMSGVKGFIYKNYCPGGTKGEKVQRQYFSDKNGMKCDSIRQKIEQWKEEKLINSKEYYFLITSLLESADRHANIVSVYGAYLKSFKDKALQDFKLRAAELIINEQEHKVYNKDANKIIKEIESDILYLDPPYNQRQYATNYHMLETIAKYDSPQIHGMTGLRNYEKEKSLYCSRNEVKKTFKDLILNAKARYIFLSYSNEGLMTSEDIKEIMSTKGKYGCFDKEYNRFKAGMARNYKAKKTIEYLHYVICDNSVEKN